MLRSDQLSPSPNPWSGPQAWVERVTAALRDSRWVTIVGPVGSGKTQLARAAGSRQQPAVHLQLGAEETAASLEAKLHALPRDEHPLLVADSADRALHALQHVGDRRQVGLTHALLSVCAHEDGALAAAWLELGKARASIDANDLQATETLDLYDAHLAGRDLPTPSTRSDESRYAQRLIETIRRHARTRVSICEDGTVVEHPTRGRAEIRSEAARRILAALVEAFERGSTPTVHRDELIRAGWPEYRSIDTASRNRFNVELSRLRKAGLHDQIDRSENGYRLVGPLLVEAQTTEG